MSDASSDLGGTRAGPVERDIEQVPSPTRPSSLRITLHTRRVHFQIPCLCLLGWVRGATHRRPRTINGH
jgi:hypothetical protein